MFNTNHPASRIVDMNRPAERAHDRPEIRAQGVDKRSATAGRALVEAPAIWFAGTSMAARTTSAAADGSWPARLSAICRQSMGSSSHRSDADFRAPSPIV
jgi:hypothetical protein